MHTSTITMINIYAFVLVRRDYLWGFLMQNISTGVNFYCAGLLFNSAYDSLNQSKNNNFAKINSEIVLNISDFYCLSSADW